ncbi:Hydroxyacylglutathione hydrolase [Saliniradius amylolyticus]|uniref:Hydroxyacylglutathione hydrolase n=1 Tax=Saliniradius amylolyticus TaxID=2183582 RepID=A0A2S2E1R8_9ALTE|nr:hydroxyacylglutathione hydrolase [Saliniradius amylolyticus]AWL11539.1 Hydroxyacylglutathione hydrolase [Saliniradius amylolyticus]
MINITPIRAFSDNYIWCLSHQNSAVVVDPGDEAPVLDYLRQHQLDLSAILITHHHADHIGGVKALVKHFPHTRVYGGPKRIPCVTHTVEGEDNVRVAGLAKTFKVISVPGHTIDHIAYYNDELGLFCGDTLFSAGCGRLFEGTPEQMRVSLARLTALPDKTPVYCAHEYTLANIAFAETLEPDNQALLDYKASAEHLREQGRPTLPSSIQKEKAVNPFLRLHSHTIRQSLEHKADKPLKDDDTRFAVMRDLKDHF